MDMTEDPNNNQKRFNGQIAGSKGAGYAEVFPDKEVEKFLKENKPEKIIIYTDGSSKGNPGPGGFAAIIIKEGKVREIGGREEMTTNNRMEMKAVIEGLKNTPPVRQAQGKEVLIEIHADSEYVIKGATLWIKNWQKNNWRTKAKKDVLNRDLWEEMLTELEKRNVSWQKVVGHSGHEMNDRCDEIATSFADGTPVSLRP